MHIYLHFVLEVLKASQYRQRVPRFDVVLEQPGPDVALASLSSVVVIVIQPEDAGDDSCTVIDTEKMLVVFLDIENYRSGNMDFRQQVLISEHKENFASLLVLLPHHVMVQNGKVIFVG